MRKLITVLILNLFVCAYSQANMGLMWFDRMSQATSQRDYQGTYVIHSNNNLQAFYLQHSNADNNSTERVVQLDQDGIEVYSDKHSITQVSPLKIPSNIQSVIKPSPFSLFANINSQQLINNYAINILPKQRISGHTAVVLHLSSDKWRYGYKIWIEQKSAIPLKVAILNDYNETVEEFRFTDIEIKEFGKFIDIAQIDTSDKNKVIHSRSKENQSINQSNIPLSPVTWKPANFKLVGSGEIKSSHESYLNYTYSDGLNTFSVLVSDLPYQKKSNDESTKSIGATNILIVSKDQKLISILGEVPIQTLQKIAKSAQFIKESDEITQ